MFRIICIVIGYALGCIQTAYIVGKLTSGIDIREFGSGNSGATNATRVLGAKSGAVVFVCDILKGVIGFLVCAALFKEMPREVAGLYGGLGVILGHNFPFYLKFKGGKGISAFIGIVICTNPIVMLITFAIGLVAFAATKYISVGSLVITFVFPFVLIFRGYPREAVVIAVVLMLLSYYQHRGNIKRILNGTESKFKLKKKGMVK